MDKTEEWKTADRHTERWMCEW